MVENSRLSKASLGSSLGSSRAYLRWQLDAAGSFTQGVFVLSNGAACELVA